MVAPINIPAVILNLKRSPERRAYMEKQLKGKGLSYRFFDAVDGEALTEKEYALYDELASICHARRPMTKGEIGCALSHLRIYEWMVAEKIPRLLILEDDVVLSHDFYKALATAEEWLPKKWHIINFTFAAHKDAFRSYRTSYQPCGMCLYPLRALPKHHFYYLTIHHVYTSGYLIDLRAAKRLLSIAYPIRVPADWLIGKIHWNGLHCYSCLPALAWPATPNHLSSTIAPRQTRPYHKWKALSAYPIKQRSRIKRYQRREKILKWRYKLKRIRLYVVLSLRYDCAREEIPYRIRSFMERQGRLLRRLHQRLKKTR